MLKTLLHLLRLVMAGPRLAMIGLVRLYQLIVSPHLRASCRYVPSCSEYAVQALQQYGFLKGTILAVWRVLRCHPWAPHGYDPPRWFGEPKPPDPSLAPEADDPTPA